MISVKEGLQMENTTTYDGRVVRSGETVRLQYRGSGAKTEPVEYVETTSAHHKVRFQVAGRPVESALSEREVGGGALSAYDDYRKWSTLHFRTPHRGSEIRWLCEQIDELRAQNAALRAQITPPAAQESPLQRAFEAYDEDLRRAVSAARERDERDRG